MMEDFTKLFGIHFDDRPLTRGTRWTPFRPPVLYRHPGTGTMWTPADLIEDDFVHLNKYPNWRAFAEVRKAWFGWWVEHGSRYAGSDMSHLVRW